jgi:hypothetical protein
MDNIENNPFETKGITEVEEVPWGMYVWETPDGEVLGDGDGNVMNVFCMKGDKRAIEAIKDAARHYGFPDGKVKWLSGHRPVTDEEYAEQEMRQRLGLVPDPLDYAAIRDQERYLNRQNG